MEGYFNVSAVRGTSERLIIGGQDYPHASLSWGQEVASDMPEVIAVASGFTGRSATATLPPAAVGDAFLSPYNDAAGHLPAPGDPVEIMASDDRGNGYRVFKGIVDTVTGEGPGARIEMIEDADGLNTALRADAIAARMPPAIPGQSWRYPAISVFYHIFLAIRAAGFHPVPPPASGCLIDIPMQGATWCERGAGVLTACRAATDPNTSPSFQPAAWGFAVSNAQMVAVPDAPLVQTGALRASMMVSPGHAGRANTTITWGDTTITLEVVEDRTVNIKAAGSTVLTFTSSQMGRATIVEVIIRGGQVQAKINTGLTKTAPLAVGPGIISQIAVNANTAARIAAVQVSDPGTEGTWHAADFTTTATMEWDDLSTGVRVLPTLRDITARELLARVTSAILAPAWVDGGGIMRVRSSKIAYELPAVAELSTSATVDEITWATERMQGRKAVTVGYTTWSEQMTRYPAVMVYDGSGLSIDEIGKRQETLISPGEGEEWVQVDTNPVLMGSSPTPAQVGAFNAGRYSAIGAAKETADGSTWSSRVFGSVTEIKPWVWRVGLMVEEDGLKMEVPTVAAWRQRGTPSVRVMAHGFIQQQEVSYTHVKPNAPANWPELSHDMGRYCHDPDVARAMAIFIATQCFYHKPVIRGMKVAYDPRLEPMRRVTVESSLHGFRAQMMVTGVKHTPDADTTEISGRVTHVTATGKTYADATRVLEGQTHANLVGSWIDYADEGADPTLGQS